MTWLTPGLAGMAAAIALPTLLVLYFLKLRRRDVEVSTTLLWKRTIQDLQANAPFQKLRRNILLLLQLLALALVLLALAQPQIVTSVSAGERTVLLIDKSASMGAPDGGAGDGDERTRLERVKQEAIAFIDALPRGNPLTGAGAPEIMVIAFDSGAEVVQSFTSNTALLRAAIDGIEQSQAGSSIEAAMQLAGPYVEPVVMENVGLRPGAPIVMWSDGAVSDLDAVRLHPESSFTYNPVGRPETPNVAITALRADRPFDRPDRAEIFVGLQNAGPAERSVDVELLLDAQVASVREARLPAATDAGPGVGGVVFSLDRSESVVVTVRLADPDGLAADDTATLVLPPARRLRAVLVTEGALFLDSVMRRLGLASYEILTPAEFTSRAAANGLPDADVAVLHDWPGPIGEQLPTGRYLVLGAIPEIGPLRPVAQPAEPEPTLVVNVLREHPVFRYVPIEELDVIAPITVDAPEASRVLVEGLDGPLALEMAHEDVRAIVLAFSPERTTWILKPSFPVFVAAALKYLGEASANLAGESLRPGETLSSRLPPEATDIRLEFPSGRSVDLRLTPDDRANFGPLREVGLHKLTWSGPPGPRDVVVDGRATRLVPVNLLDRAESMLGSRDALVLPTGAVTGTRRAEGNGLTAERLWPWLIAAALLLVLVEWYVFNRKVHV